MWLIAGEAGVAPLHTSTLRTVLCDIPPLVATTVIAAVPATVVVPAVMVSVEEPVPGAGIVGLLNEAVTPAGNPETDRETSALKVALAVVETATTLDPPNPMATAAGVAEKEKSAVDDAKTFTVIEAACVVDPAPPVRVTG